MTNKNESSKGIRKPLWLLYVDVNVRANIMLDDATSIQQLALRYIEDRTTLRLLLDGNLGSTPSSRRVWTIAGNALERRFLVRDRSLLEIWRMVGNGAKRIEGLQARIATAFCAAYYSDTSSFPADVAQFVVDRHRLISSVADEYLSSLQLAREKLSQILENRPGALPAPLAQRRWANSLYVDFLGSYSFRARREVAHLYEGLKRNGPPDDNAMRDVEKRMLLDEDFIHGIGYASTSETKSSRHGEGNERKRQVITKSSYFYPEQPTLLPMLYHEFAHHYPTRVSEAIGPLDGFDAAFSKLAYAISEEYVGQGFFHDLPDSRMLQFWEEVLEEMKADTIAVALGGVDYLHALLLQVLGQEGEWIFGSDRDIRGDPRADTMIALTDPKPSYDRPAVFASTLRLLFASALLRKIAPEAFSDRLDFINEFCCCADALCTTYLTGLLALVQGRTRPEWIIYAHRVESSIPAFRSLGEIIGEKFGAILAGGSQFSGGLTIVAPATTRALNAVVTNYCNSVLVPILGSTATSSHKFDIAPAVPGGPASIGTIRIESAPLSIRWYIGGLIERGKIDEYGYQRVKTITGDAFLQHVCVGFTNYFRNDGSVAFRYLLELFIARRHLMREVGELLGDSPEPSSKLSMLTSNNLSVFKAALLNQLQAAPALRQRISEYGDTCASTVTDSELIRLWLTSPLCEESVVDANGVRVHELPISCRNSLLEPTQAFLQIDSALADSLNRANGPLCGSDVGMFELGTVTPDPIHGQADRWETAKEAYFGARDQLKRARIELEKCANPNGVLKLPKAAFDRVTCRTAGEYQYASILTGTTPVERDCVVGIPLRALSKPRFVISVAGQLGHALRPAANREVRALTLMRLRARHHWVPLRDHVVKIVDTNATVMLSTAWETLVIVWSAQDTRSFWTHASKFSEFGDTHTLLIASDVLTETTITYADFEALAGSCNSDEKLNFRTGRYDFAKNFPKLTVNELVSKLDSIHGQAWRAIEKISAEAKIPVVESSSDGTTQRDVTLPSKNEFAFDWMLRKMDRKS